MNLQEAKEILNFYGIENETNSDIIEDNFWSMRGNKSYSHIFFVVFDYHTKHLVFETNNSARIGNKPLAEWTKDELTLACETFIRLHEEHCKYEAGRYM